MKVQSYFGEAMRNEALFRSVLRDLRENRKTRICGEIIPEDLETEAGLDAIFERYSDGWRMGKFTIVDFNKVDASTAEVCFETVMPLAGRGAKLRYKIKPENQVDYAGKVFIMRS